MFNNRRAKRLTICCLVFFVGILFSEGISFAQHRCSDTAIIVLGTRPLDAQTPSLDMIFRVQRGIELYKQNPSALLIFTGGKTAGPISEARMMAKLACGYGVLLESIILEENSRSTIENARFTAAYLSPCVLKKTILVSRKKHFKRAVPIFSQYPAFGNIQPVASHLSQKKIILNLQEYLAHHKSPEVQAMLDKIKEE